jgi:hypothetical protein
MVPARKTSHSSKTDSATAKNSSTQKRLPPHTSKGRPRKAQTNSDENSPHLGSDAEEVFSNESDTSVQPELDSDALDEEDDYITSTRKKGKVSKPKRKRHESASSKTLSRKKAKAGFTKSTKYSRVPATEDGQDETDDELTGEYVEELNVVEAPKTGWGKQCVLKMLFQEF